MNHDNLLLVVRCLFWVWVSGVMVHVEVTGDRSSEVSGWPYLYSGVIQLCSDFAFQSNWWAVELGDDRQLQFEAGWL